MTIARAVGLVGLVEIHRRRTPILLLLDLEANFLPFAQAAQPRLLNRADVNEDVLAPGIGSDEPIAFGRVEPLYGAHGHRRVAFLPADAFVGRALVNRGIPT